jgi:hypothetical protein
MTDAEGFITEVHDLHLFTHKVLKTTQAPAIIECHGDKCRVANEHVICISCSAVYPREASRVKLKWLSKPKMKSMRDWEFSYGDKPIIHNADRLEVTRYVRG